MSVTMLTWLMTIAEEFRWIEMLLIGKHFANEGF